MQLDYAFIKDLLNTMQERDSHYMSVSSLAKEAKPKFEETDEDVYMDKFFGHLQVLKDCRVIEEVLGRNLGVVYQSNGTLAVSGCCVRLTALGYDLTKLLNKKGAIEKLKKATLKESVVFCEAFIVKSAEKIIDLMV